MENLEKKTKADLIALVRTLQNDAEANAKQISQLDDRCKSLEKQIAKSVGQVVTDGTRALHAELAAANEVNEQLRLLVLTSCRDHCPHHGPSDACTNCGIHKRLTAILAQANRE